MRILMRTMYLLKLVEVLMPFLDMVVVQTRLTATLQPAGINARSVAS